MALNLGSIGVTPKIAEHIILTYEKLMEKGSDFSVKDACYIKAAIDKKYNNSTKEEEELCKNK